MIDLRAITVSWIEREGHERVKEILKEKLDKNYSDATVKNWQRGTVDPPMAVAQVVIDDSRINIDVDEKPFSGAKIYIGSCVYRDVSPWTYKATHVLRHRYGDQLGLLMEVGTDLALRRNRLVERFLKTEGQWLLWLDDDMAPPIGYPSESKKWGAKFDEQYNRVDVLERLMSHGKTFVSALCFDRAGQGIPMFAEGRNSSEVAQRIRSGPSDKLLETDWVGSGCVLIHRRVFEDVLYKMPSIKTKGDTPNGYYTAIDHGYGEDVSFAIRAKECGHQPYVDLGCICGHAGPIVHYNEKIR